MIRSLAFAATLFVIASASAHAGTIVLKPTSDGSLYVCNGCNVVNDGSDVTVSGYIQGDVKFANPFINDPYLTAVLTLNPYALPLFGTDVYVYGYGTSDSALELADANAGTYIGTLVLPDLGYGEDTFFDVSVFVRSTNAPFLAFNLRTDSGGTDSFSSLEYNYGHPSELLVTSVPESSSALLILAGLLAIATSKTRINIT